MWKLPSSLRTTNCYQDHLKQKVILEVFLSWHGIMHHKFIPENATVSKERCTETLTWCILRCGWWRNGHCCMTMPWHAGHYLCSCSSPGMIGWSFPTHSFALFLNWWIFISLCARRTGWRVVTFKDAVDIQTTSEIVLQVVAHSDFQKCQTMVQMLTEVCSCWRTVFYRHLCLRAS